MTASSARDQNSWVAFIRHGHGILSDFWRDIRAHQSPRPRKIALSSAAPAQSRGLVSVGRGGVRKGAPENKPIFLSVGYSTCHWCHVMAHECFENPETAKLMNEHFVNIKVDREERPDVDRVYMTYVQATTGSGGWPMSVFLTPDLKPFYGGTYFPPEDRYGRPGFPTAAPATRRGLAARPQNIVEQARPDAIEALQRAYNHRPPSDARDRAKSIQRRVRSARAHLRRRTRRLRRRAEISAARHAQFSFPHFCARRPIEARSAGRAGAWRCSPCEKWPLAACTIISAAASIATRWIASGTSRISRKCSTIRPSSPCSYLDAFQVTHDPLLTKPRATFSIMSGAT